jgi:hypothetical protein
MTFINEYIPDDDKKKHNITPDSNFYLAGIESWTVDRERNMFLMRRTGGGAEGYPIHHWAFYWRGHMLDARLQLIDAGGDHRGGHGWARIKLVDISGISPALQESKPQIIDDLKDALTAHKGTGVLSSRTSYEVTLVL